MTQPAKRSFSANESDAMDVDSEAMFTQSGASLVEIVQGCVSFESNSLCKIDFNLSFLVFK